MKREKPETAREKLAGFHLLVAPALSVRGRPAGPLSPALEGYTPPEDAAAVSLLKAAGAALSPVPSSAELAFGLAGDAAAQTLKETGAAAALGLDTLGEIRLAAAAAGLVGYKPSYGIFSRAGVIGLVPSMECPGLIAENVAPIQKIAAVLAVPDEADFSMLRQNLPDFRKAGPAAPRPARLGVIRECKSALLPEEAAALARASSLLEERGFTVREVSLPAYDLFPLAHRIIATVEASSSAGNYDGVRFGYRAEGGENWNEMYLQTRGEAFSTLLKSYLFQGAYFQFEDYGAFENACRIRRRLVEETKKLFKEIDFLILPALRPGRDPGEAKTVADTYQAFAHTLPASVLGAPAVTIPQFALTKNSDLGLQLIGPHLSDASLLQLAARITEAGDKP